jgi:hypothetical protein
MLHLYNEAQIHWSSPNGYRLKNPR